MALIVSSGVAETTAVLMQHRVVRELSHPRPAAGAGHARLRAVLGDAQRGLRGYLLTGDGQVLDTYHVPAASTRWPACTCATWPTPGRDVAVDAQLARADIWWSLAEQQRRAPPRSDAAARYVTEGKPLFQAFVAANEAFDASLAVRAATLQRRSSWLGWDHDRRADRADPVAAADGRGDRAGDRPVGSPGRSGGVVTMLPSAGAGRLDVRADTARGPTEIRAVAAAFNAMADEGDRIRAAESDVARLRGEVRELGYPGSGPTCGSATRSTRRSGGWPPSCGPSTCWSGWRRGRPTCRT
ncbi:hypothetical protein GCM10020358_81520 [Amorphoplanes nipponensis]|uniref:CHASE3 domain-containing protein n=1 Tax=Actinoplanes nipponensis TaxID=135950 RepID=UPI0031F00A3A